MPDLIGAEIFATGKWNDLEFSDDDIDDIVANFEALGDIHKVPLKLGHNDEQQVTDGQPALGWVQKVYKQGNKLLADFVDMPNVIYDAIKQKLYRTVSVELLFNVNHDGSKYNHVLDAVALLGADHPAVNTLQDLQTLMATRTEFSGGRRLVFETLTGRKKPKRKKGMDEEEVKKLIAAALKPLETANEELKTENADLKKKLEKRDEEAAEFSRKQEEEKVKAARKEVTELLDTAVKDKKMTPAVRETYAKQIGLEDDERVLEIDLEQVKIMCDATKGVDDKETGLDGDSEDDHENPEAKLLALTRKNRSADETFEAAFMRTAEANPKLHRAYLDMNGEEVRR